MADVGLDYFLPDVRCRACGEEWGAPWFAFPTINPPWIQEFPYTDDGDNPVVSWKKFRELTERVSTWDPCAATVIPGAAIGPPSGTVSQGDLPEIMCDEPTIILSMAVIQHLKENGMKEPYAPVFIRYRGKVIRDLYVVEPRIVNALTDCQRRELVRRECSTCGFLDLKPMSLKEARSFSWKYDRTAITDMPFFFVARETGTMVFTESFIQIIQPYITNELSMVYDGEIV